jgi:tetratricopeptide (TPR) repeat protein
MTAFAPGNRLNAFQQTMLGLEYTEDSGRRADLFSQACVEQYRECAAEQFGYLFAQVFEPAVLRESAMLADVPFTHAESLEHQPTAAIRVLARLVKGAEDLSAIARINLASALISISRFGAAQRVLDCRPDRVLKEREAFEAAMLEFVIANRSADGAGSGRAFARMREAIDAGPLPPERVLDACAQAVVWFVKRGEISQDDYARYLETGTALAGTPGLVESAALSSWYRAIAMIPAREGAAAETRGFMERAREAAEAALSLRPRAYELHLKKTYYESSLKEHLYVTRDVDKAEEAGHSLIALDPAWAPSYGELAEVYARSGRLAAAADRYEQAAAAGPPYYGHHLAQAARCRERAGQEEQALELYLTLAGIADLAPALLADGLRLARKLADPSQAKLEAMLTAAVSHG